MIVTIWSVKNRLIAGFSVITAFAAGVSLVGYLAVADINITLNQLTDVSAPTVEVADDLIMTLWESAKVAEEVAASLDEDEISLFVGEFDELMAFFDTAEAELRGIVEADRMIAHLNEAGDVQSAFVEQAAQLFDHRIRYLVARASAYAQLRAFDEAGAALNARLNEVAQANEAEMALAEEEGDTLQARSAPGADINAILGELFERDYPMVRAAMTLQRQTVEMQDTAGEYLAETDGQALSQVIDEFETLHGQVSDQLTILGRYIETEADGAEIEALTHQFSRFLDLATGDGALFATHRDMVSELDLSNEALNDLEISADQVADALDLIAETADAVSDIADDTAASAVEQANMVILTVLGLTLLLSIGLIAMVIRTVTGPINAMTDTMSRLASGDTGVTVPSTGRQDEIGAMAQAVQVFKDGALERIRLQQEQEALAEKAEAEKRRSMNALADRFNQKVGTIIERVAQRAGELQNSAGLLGGAVDEAEAQSNAASTAANDASGTVQAMAAAAEELNAAVNEVTSQLNTVAGKVQATAEGARSAQSRMDDLQSTVAQIDQVVKSINDVAEQTNLLALNATIEAARAGEAGRGFAVVASEVKGLANQTRQMTDNIAEQLAAVKEASEAAVRVSRSIVKDVDDVNNSASIIASSMEEQGATTAEISRNAHQASSGTQNASTNIDGVRSASTQTSQAADSVRRVSDDLAAQAEGLGKAVATFLNEVRAA